MTVSDDTSKVIDVNEFNQLQLPEKAEKALVEAPVSESVSVSVTTDTANTNTNTHTIVSVSEVVSDKSHESESAHTCTEEMKT